MVTYKELMRELLTAHIKENYGKMAHSLLRSYIMENADESHMLYSVALSCFCPDDIPEENYRILEKEFYNLDHKECIIPIGKFKVHFADRYDAALFWAVCNRVKIDGTSYTEALKFESEFWFDGYHEMIEPLCEYMDGKRETPFGDNESK